MDKSNTTICAASKCYSSLVTHPNKSFFGFPSNISLCKTWLENCGRTDLDVQKVIKAKYWKNCRICEDHFEDKWFTDSSKKILKRKLNPVPTIFVNNISSLLPPGTEPDSIDVDYTLNAEDPRDYVTVELLDEMEELNESDFDVKKLSLKKQQLPISYHTNSLVKPVEFSTKLENTKILNLNLNTDLHNLDKICRFCMHKISVNHVDLFSKADDAKEIIRTCEIILPNEVSVCDGLPHKVCQECVVDLKTCQRLIERFRNADRYLRAIAKYSLFMDIDDTTEIIANEEVDGGTDDDSICKSVPKDGIVLPLSSNTVQENVAGSSGYLDELNGVSSLSRPNMDNSNSCIYSTTSNDSNHHKNSDLEETGKRGETVNRFPCSLKKDKQIFNRDVKFYQKAKKITSNSFKNQIIMMPQDYLDNGTRVPSICQLSEFGCDNSMEGISFSSPQSSDLFNLSPLLTQDEKITFKK